MRKRERKQYSRFFFFFVCMCYRKKGREHVPREKEREEEGIS
jgi:hypothetical protein